MKKFTKKDFIYSLITGLTTGLIAWRIFTFLGRPTEFNVPMSWLVVIVPILWMIGVCFGYFLGQWMPFFNQFGRFVAVGFTNAAVDFGILNVLIWYFGMAAGAAYAIFKSVSFLVGVLHSYFWNKLWVFESSDKNPAAQFGKFLVVGIVAALVNVSAASLVVNFIHPLLGLAPNAWANIGAVVGSATALIFSFVGFRLVVFKKNSV